MAYDFTQRGRVYRLLYAGAAVCLVAAFLLRDDSTHFILLLLHSSVLTLTALSCQWMRVFDTGDALCIAFGPLPFIGRTIPLADVTDVRLRPLHFNDVAGVDHLSRRGRTYELGSCEWIIVVELGASVVRIGTPDAFNLLRFLMNKLPHLLEVGAGVTDPSVDNGS